MGVELHPKSTSLRWKRGGKSTLRSLLSAVTRPYQLSIHLSKKADSRPRKLLGLMAGASELLAKAHLGTLAIVDNEVDL